MFYKTKVKDHIRVPPSLFGIDLDQAIIKEVKKKFGGYISKELGMVIECSSVDNIGEGIIIPGDGASYYETTFTLIIFKPEMQETLWGKVKDIAEFGAFMTIGPIDGMIHISQSMNDFVSFSKDKVLLGKDTKRTLKVGDNCRAKIIAISYKDILNPKIGLMMRQQGLGKEEWTDIPKEAKESKKAK
ncbi:DNA-directed RNA polymerase [Candidatus Woesearchaeota archaeon]|nr:MAG: DNA-directed RNA polymerase [Candidatus Woesearchaeota archaeon]